MTKYIFFLIVFLSPIIGSSQYAEFGISGGLTNYQGDLSDPLTFDSLTVGATRGAAGILGKINLNRFWSIRGSFTYGKAVGDDRISSNPARKGRNLRSFTDIFELAAIAEFNILGYDPVYSEKKFSPYLFMGVAGYYFNPKADYNGRLVELQPLGTEGQGAPNFPKKYSRYSISIPIGAGLKFALNESWSVGLEVGGRRLFHDYLDDVSGSYAGFDVINEANGEIAANLANRTWELTDSSPAAITASGQRGNEKFFDWYYFSLATLTYHLPGNGRRRRGGRGNQMGCPGF